MNMQKWAEEQKFNPKYILLGLYSELKNNERFRNRTIGFILFVTFFILFYFFFVGPVYDNIITELKLNANIITFIIKIMAVAIVSFISLVMFALVAALLLDFIEKMVGVLKALNVIGAREAYKSFTLLSEGDSKRDKNGEK